MDFSNNLVYRSQATQRNPLKAHEVVENIL